VNAVVVDANLRNSAKAVLIVGFVVLDYRWVGTDWEGRGRSFNDLTSYFVR
jgi:hypothetical protein